ncbi:MAG: hypothetical protein QXW37_00585 [Candidatus Nitrosotenuis sp.]
MKKRHLEKIGNNISDDPMDAYRSVILRSGKIEQEQKDIEETVAEAGHETRSVNQVVKLVNLHLSEKVKRLNEIKAASKRFDDELNMFTNPITQETSRSSELQINPTPQEPSKTLPTNPTIESQPVYNDLLDLINKYGFKQLSQALDAILSKNQSTHDRSY